jgi:hypothetical protein
MSHPTDDQFRACVALRGTPVQKLITDRLELTRAALETQPDAHQVRLLQGQAQAFRYLLKLIETGGT